MARNKNLICKICRKQIRSDTLARHSKSCLKKMKKSSCIHKKKECTQCGKNISIKNWARHLMTHAYDKSIINDVKEDQRKFENKVKIGKTVKKAIRNKVAHPRSLKQEYLDAVNAGSDSDTSSETVLKLWQQKLIKKLVPSERNIIWVVGQQGGEGKSFFQRHIVKIIGTYKSFLSTIDKKGDAILHALSKRELPLIDVFIFNVPRSFESEDVPYCVFEDIKDGFCLSSKYNSKQLKFNSPNILVVFSNHMPLTNKMSHDRWNLYKIENDDLIIQF